MLQDVARRTSPSKWKSSRLSYMLVEILSFDVDKFKSRNGTSVSEVLFNCSVWINCIKHSLKIFITSTIWIQRHSTECFNNIGLIFMRKEKQKNISEDILEMPQWRITAFPRHQREEKWGTNKDKTITKTCLFKYTENLTAKTENFQIKKSDIFHISAQNIECGYSLEPPQRGGSNEYPQSMFFSRNKKNNVYPCKPQFYYTKVEFKGINII